MIATYINAIAIILGCIIGLLFRKIISERIKKIIYQGAGLSSLLMGILMVVKTKHPVLVVFSILLGGIIGEILKIEARLEKLGDYLMARVKQKESSTFTQGFVTASLIFCVGAMTIIGSINASTGSYNLLLVKSIMDGTISIAFASILGIGVMFSALIVLIYQGALTYLASFLLFIKSPIYLNEISGAGGILIVSIGINLLFGKKIKIGNFIPALFLIIIFVFLKLKFPNLFSSL